MSLNEKTKAIQDDLKENAQKIWLAGLGALTIAGEEGSKLFNSLVEKGQSFETRTKPGFDGVKNTYEGAKSRAEDLWSKSEGMVSEKIGAVLQKMGVPTRDEITQLTERVDALMEAINKLNK